MERAGRIIAGLKAARKHLSAEDLVFAAWPAATGAKLAGRTRPSAVRDGSLVVEVEDELWRRNLHGLRGQLLRNLQDLLGDIAPREIEFKVGLRRRPPQSESTQAAFPLAASAVGAQEADTIADPVLRRIYLNSRRKARA
jgi:hypothetical protein